MSLARAQAARNRFPNDAFDSVLDQLSTKHAWTEEEVNELADKFHASEDFWWPRGHELPDPPERMPNSAPKGQCTQLVAVASVQAMF